MITGVCPRFTCGVGAVVSARSLSAEANFGSSMLAARQFSKAAALQSLIRTAQVPAPAGCRAMLSLDPSAKRKMVRIGTHSGTFHCDEALGCFLLQQLNEFKDAELVRTRDYKQLEELDVVLDVGGVYDPGFTTKLSSAGLVYKHHGREIIAQVLGQPTDHPDVMTVYLSVYKHFMEAIDAIDNGINQYVTDAPPKYLSNTHLSARVGGLNPRWNQDSSEEELSARFRQAMALTGREFMEVVDYFAQCWLPARSLVKEAIASRTQVDDSGEIIELSQGGLPWKQHLYELEPELGVERPIKFVIYEDDRERKWRVQAVSEAPGSFANRKSLPAAWQGLRDEELTRASGIPGGVFVHASGFIGGNATREGSLAMARQALVMD